MIAIAGPASGEAKKTWSDEPAVPAGKLCRDYFRLFDGVREAARAARAQASCFGIMGSSIAAAWLAQEVGGVAFFVLRFLIFLPFFADGWKYRDRER